jgi:orotate phosphoribosyltransferase
MVKQADVCMLNGLYPQRNMIETREDFLALLKEDAYKKGDFKLSSGKKSEHYVNCKPVTLQGDALMFISWCMFECIEEDCDAVGGLTLGADPLVAGVAMVSAIEERYLDGLIVRKEPKGHGTKAWIEGPTLAPGSKVTVLEDVITTGGSAIKAAKRLRDAGYAVENVVAIINRQEGTEADDAMDDADLNLISLFKLEELI